MYKTNLKFALSVLGTALVVASLRPAFSGGQIQINPIWVRLQPSTPGTSDQGNLHVSGKAIAGSFSGDGASVTNVNAAKIGGNPVTSSAPNGSDVLTWNGT